MILMENRIIAYALLNISVGKEYDVINKLNTIENIAEAHIVYGEYDIIVKIEAPTLKSLEKTVMSIRKIPGVIRSTTLIST